ncbi:hypothetical protein [Streptomyces sp. NPDC055105]|uniref:hypothetical protein n=1 Tax=Streptomyces sp. NPDC055105 TaxID=3365719 RepID=UPI0037D6ED44
MNKAITVARSGRLGLLPGDSRPSVVIDSRVTAASRSGPAKRVTRQMSVLTMPNAAVANTPASARERSVDSSQGRLTRTVPPGSHNRPRMPART